MVARCSRKILKFQDSKWFSVWHSNNKKHKTGYSARVGSFLGKTYHHLLTAWDLSKHWCDQPGNAGAFAAGRQAAALRVWIKKQASLQKQSWQK